MSNRLETNVYHWLRQLNIPVSKNYLKERIATHPEYPSLLSITDTVNEMGINCQAIVIDKDVIQEVKVPVLVFIKGGNGGFIWVKDLLKYARDNPSFMEVWNGVIVMAEKTEGWEQTGNGQKWKQDRILKYIKGILFAGLLLLFARPIIQIFPLIDAILLLTTLAGIGLMTLITQKELGYTNDFTDRLCNVGKSTDCEAVLQSKGAAVLGWMDFADVGMIYFSATALLQITSFFTGEWKHTREIISLFTITSLPFTLLSIYYQGRKVKKWCVLCLLTAGLLWTQFFILLPDILKDKWTPVPLNTSLLSIFLFLFTTAVWMFLLKPFLQQRIDWQETVWPLLRFKRKPEVFVTLLKKEKQIDTSPIREDLVLGNPYAPIQIMMACSPYCAPCAREHKELHKLLERYRENIGVTIRFALNAEAADAKRTKAVRHILETWLEEKEKQQDNGRNDRMEMILEDWFAWMDLEKFQVTYPPIKGKNATELMAAHGRWAGLSGITQTPTFFLSGYQLPGIYAIRDLPDLLPFLPELITPVSVDAYTVNECSA
jgi:uncharacterized membrane protein